MRTIAEFRATKRWTDDLGEAIGFDTGRGKIAGWVYVDQLYVEDTKTWPGAERADYPPKRYYLILDRSEWFADAIEELEPRLFGYWLSEDLEVAAPILNDALDAACKSIQDALGITKGDVAGQHFSGTHRDEFNEVMVAYVLAEAMR